MARAAVAERPRIEAQPGPQTAFLSTVADIAVFGGAAGGGKSHALLVECVRNVGVRDYGAVVFRRTSTQITGQGGLWDASRGLYPALRAEPVTQPRYHWRFPSGAKVTFAHLQYDKDVLDWQGSEIPLIAYDELTHFTEYQFFYMLSRNRSTCGVRPYIRATTNPDADSWVARLIAWWIDPETGYPIPERSGALRYFTRLGEEMVWGDTPEAVVAQAGERGLDGAARELVKSITFIPSTLADNAILVAKDPSYRANLLALPRVERERLLGGNWKARRSGGTYFPSAAVGFLQAAPTDVKRWVRAWDLAATEPHEGNRSPDATAGLLMGERANGRYVVADAVHLRVNADKVRRAVGNTAQRDRAGFGRHEIVVPEDPGQAGKEQAQSYVKMLAGFNASAQRETGDKEVRAEAFSAQWHAGNVDLVEGPWNEPYLAEMEAFPDGDNDDQVDASSAAFRRLTQRVDMVRRWEAMTA